MLETRGFVNPSYPTDLRRGVETAMHAWEVFCALPNDLKQRITYTADGNVSGVGYELKLDEGSTLDLKEDFHLRLSEEEHLKKEAQKVGDIALNFVDIALKLSALMAPVIHEFTEEVETQLGLKGFTADTARKHPRALLRFLHYFGDRNVGDVLAVPHVDKDGFTLHLYESHHGLEYLTHDGVWEPMEFSHAQTAVIPAMRMQYRSQNRLKATCHRIVATDETAGPGRFSAVCFFDFSGTPYYDKVKQGRLQDREPGFNYRMPFNEFSKLFVDSLKH
jgi:isopenicillin N synthase-like dioxygenase